jgi:DNA polymerase elongation subunit (family B)
MLRTGRVAMEDLIIEKRLSKAPADYTNHVEQAIAAGHLVNEGGSVHGGQSVRYVIASSDSEISNNHAIPIELLTDSTQYDLEKYVTLLLSSAMDLLLPFGYDLDSLRRNST